MDTIRGILAKADRLTDDSLRRFHGEFFTPIPFATKALDYIAETIGQEWWKSGEYRLWDMAAGTGNLEYNLPASAWKYCYLSTLEETDVEHLKRLFPDANIFQYNYLDDDVDVITQKVRAEKANEKSLENLVSYHKLPENLVADLNNPNVKWIIFINPPFGTSQAGGNTAKRENKAGIHNTNIRRLMHECNLGEVSRELFSQFLFRIKYEFTAKNAHLVLFSTLKYINATNDTKFRNNIFQFEFVRGFVFSSVNFSGTAKGNGFPVGCILWNLSKSINLNNQKIILDVLSNNTSKVSSKRIEVKDKSKFLSNWIKRPSCTHIFPPFSSAIIIKPGNKDKRDRIADGFVGCLRCAGNDFQCLNLTFLLSGPAVSAGALSVTAENFEQAVVVHAARRIPQSTWINDRDQFLAPQKDLSTEFITDCAVWSLFADSNQTAALKDVEYEGTIYQIHNHFFPFPVSEIKQWTISDPDIRQTLFSAEDTFVCRWLNEHVLSKEAQTLLHCGKEIYRFYFAHLNALRTTKFKIATWDAGWYQIRMALKNADLAADLIAELKEHHRLLRLKLLPQLTQYGILN